MKEIDKNIWFKGFDDESLFKSIYDLMKVEGHFPILYHGETSDIPTNLNCSPSDYSYCIIYKTC